ncbi:DUF2092 domain-containing protein [Adhaeribacter sp. BT258]|uniref:DUF2092 domain-containing protein n=1 Tax=Adhaeribacter terrigena TaxID=2793070 RepID=A0ABS1C5L7_9BACT|nr:DUF2092 domain-containing protein [Adhaeribacter terrigena]MBK0404680.1 DUF2092 domain-containing protein [Adhaeribacter terrigena]
MNNPDKKKPAAARWFWFSVMLIAIISISWKMLSVSYGKTETLNLFSAKIQTPKIDKQADKILKQMSDHLTAMQQFSYKSQGSYEVVDKDKKKEQLTYSSEVFVKRPNKLRVNAKNNNRDAAVYYDGKQFTVLGKNANMYAVAEAPPTLDAALDSARDRFQMDPPGADLIYSNPYKGLMEEATQGQLVGEEVINGKASNHLAFKSKEVDWDIWIQKGSSPVPLRYKIISKNIPARPEFIVNFTDWKQGTGPDFADQQFVFSPPANSKKIPFMRLGDAPTASNTKKK